MPGSVPRITSVQPSWAVEGGRVTVYGDHLSGADGMVPEILVGHTRARVLRAGSTSLSFLVPAGLEGGPNPVRVASVPGATASVEIGAPLATGLHQVDNPAFDRDGNLYLTYSGSRGQQVPVSIFRVRRDGARETFASGIVNPTSLVFDAAGDLYVSSRFEGTIHRVSPDGRSETVATDLGVACGLAFGAGGELYVGDRSGTIFRTALNGRADTFASLPASVAAFHLAFGPDTHLYVAGPTLAPRDPVYRIAPDGTVGVVHDGFGRPQGLAFDRQGSLYVVEALAGSSALYRLTADGAAEAVLAGAGLVGVAFDPLGGLVVASNETVYRLDVPVRPAG
jgi:sugar lactone lactonase YvrE